MREFFHVTDANNLESILKSGLTPKVGDRSKLLGEKPGIFMFPSMECMEDAFLGWFGDVYDEDTRLAILKITLEDDFDIENSTVGYEVISRIAIPSENISFIRYE